MQVTAGRERGRAMLLAVLATALLAEAGCTDTDRVAEDLSWIAGDLNETLHGGPGSRDGDGGDGGAGAAAADGAAVDEAMLLIEAALAGTAGLASRGEMTVHMPSDGSDLSQPRKTQFEHDGSGAAAMHSTGAASEVAPGDGGEALRSGISEIRYVDDIAYMRIPTAAAETAGVDVASIRSETVWVTAGPGTDEAVDAWNRLKGALDGMAAAEAGSGGGIDAVSDYPLALLCDFRRSGTLLDSADASTGCHPMSAAASVVEAAVDAEIVGHEEIRGDATTEISFTVPLHSLASRSSSVYKGVMRDILREFGDKIGEDRDLRDLSGFEDLSRDIKQIIRDLLEGAHRLSLGDMADALKNLMVGLFKRDLDVDIEARVWIDDDMRIRRLSYSLDSILDSLRNANFKVVDTLLGDEIDEYILNRVSAGDVTMEYYDFTEDGSVEAPQGELLLGDYSLLTG